MFPPQYFKRSTTNRLAGHFLALVCGLACLRVTAANSQTATSSHWTQLRRADSQVNASQTMWKCFYIQQASRVSNVEKAVAQAKEQARQRGIDEKQAESIGQSTQQMLNGLSMGKESTTLLSFAHQGKATRCEIRSTGLSAPGKSSDLTNPADAKAVHVEYYDGQNIINVDTAASSAGQTQAQALKVGIVRRDGQDILPHVALGNLPLLVGTPMFTDLSATNSSWREGSDDTLILEKPLKAEPPFPAALIRWTISKSTWRPLIKETLWQPTGKVFNRIRFLNYQLRSGGVQFPGRIIDERLTGNAGVVNEKPRMVYDYTLTQAAFNQAADTGVLQHPIPPGTKMGDHRFAPRPTVGYTATDGAIQSDAEVLKLVEQREAYEAEMARQTRQQIMKKLALPAGLLLMAVGVLMLRRQNRAATTQPKTAGTTPKKV